VPVGDAGATGAISSTNGEAIIATGLKPASWTYAEEYVGEDEVLAAARARAEEVGVSPLGSGAGAVLRLLASLIEARAVVEIGTGTGTSGIWLLRGMRPDGVLTTVDTQAEHQRLARTAFTEAGIPSQRVRLIPGAALEVLPRLTDGHYDLVFADGDKTEYAEYLAEALRLLKPGGIVVFDDALWHDREGQLAAHESHDRHDDGGDREQREADQHELGAEGDHVAVAARAIRARDRLRSEARERDEGDGENGPRRRRRRRGGRGRNRQREDGEQGDRAEAPQASNEDDQSDAQGDEAREQPVRA